MQSDGWDSARLGCWNIVSAAPDPQPGRDQADPHQQAAVESPGDSDAPDAPDSETIYPDEQGVPGEPDDR